MNKHVHALTSIVKSALNMTHLDLFLQKGPSNGIVVPGLEELRRIVLLDGIPSNSDGMVRFHVALEASSTH